MPEPEPRDRLAFVICTERGLLERKSVMLVKSLRAFGGRLADARVLSYSPREGRHPAPRTLRWFHDAGVQAVLEPLNTEWPEYGFGNKVVACAHAEEHASADRLVFLDSDMLILDEPGALLAGDSGAVRLRPVERKIAGSTGSDEHADYWHALFDFAGIDEPLRVETTVGGEEIYGYWNAGIVSAPTAAGFFRRWEQTLRALFEEERIHPMGRDFMDQIALALTVQSHGAGVEELPPGYNVPVGASARAVGGANGLGDPDDIVIAHYHRMFDSVPLHSPLGGWAGWSGYGTLRRIVGESGLVGFPAWLGFRVGLRLRRLRSALGLGGG